MVSYSLGIDIKVKGASRKSRVNKEPIHFFIPTLRSLLEVIQGFLEVVDKDGVTLNTSKRLFHINLFLEIVMQEFIFDIHFMDLPSI
jgi:hypothetical protein